MTEMLRGPAGVARAAALLRDGRLVAFGTETVYGLGGDATNGAAVAAIFAAKGRPRFNPLICHFAEPGAAFAQVRLSDTVHAAARAFWPGPLTLVLPREASSTIHPLAAAGLDTLAVRVPGNDLARALMKAAGRPVAAPSANRSGGVSPTTAGHVHADLAGRIDAILDTGPASRGLESTVLDLTGPQPVLLRPGAVPLDGLEAVLGPILRSFPDGTAPRSPGLLLSHYAPGLRLRLEAAAAAPDEALLAFGPPPVGAALAWSLSATGDLAEAAARLFAGLRYLDGEGSRLGLRRIAVMPVPDTGLGEAINDRLRRAAAPRP